MSLEAVVPRKKQAIRRARTRDALIGAGEGLFARRPIDSVTIDEIVEAARVAKGSFYNHFEDKDALAQAIVDMVRGDCEFHIFRANRAIQDAPMRIVRAQCVMIRYGFEHRERLQAMLSLTGDRTSAESPLNAGVVADVRDGLLTGRLSGIDLESGILVVIGIINVTVVHILSHAEELISMAEKTGGAMLRALGISAEESLKLAKSAADEILGDLAKGQSLATVSSKEQG